MNWSIFIVVINRREPWLPRRCSWVYKIPQIRKLHAFAICFMWSIGTTESMAVNQSGMHNFEAYELHYDVEVIRTQSLLMGTIIQ